MSPSLLYLFAAFAVVWVGLFGYWLYLSHRMSALQQQVELLLEEQAEEHPVEKTERTASAALSQRTPR